jgi:hypothetical protein
MYLHPDLLLDQFHARQRELYAEADRSRLLATALRARRDNKTRINSERGAGHTDQRKSPAVRGRPDGSLAGCGAHAAAPAR